MIKKLTKVQLAKIDANIISFAKTMTEKFGAEKASMMVWNKYGYRSGTKNGKVTVQLSTGYTIIN